MSGNNIYAQTSLLHCMDLHSASRYTFTIKNKLFDYVVRAVVSCNARIYKELYVSMLNICRNKISSTYSRFGFPQVVSWIRLHTLHQVFQFDSMITSINGKNWWMLLLGYPFDNKLHGLMSYCQILITFQVYGYISIVYSLRTFPGNTLSPFYINLYYRALSTSLVVNSLYL